MAYEYTGDEVFGLWIHLEIEVYGYEYLEIEVYGYEYLEIEVYGLWIHLEIEMYGLWIHLRLKCMIYEYT